MLIKYTEWRDAVRFSSIYDSNLIWNKIKKEIKIDREARGIELSNEDFDKINENTIIAILTDNNGADWTKNITVRWYNGWSESLHDYLETLCDDIEYDIIMDNCELEDYGDRSTHDRREVS